MAASAQPVALVLDTNVCLDLLLFADSAVERLAGQLSDGSVRAYRDAQTTEEWRRVLGYAVWGLSGERQRELQSRFEALLLPLTGAAAVTATLPTCRDPDDQKFLQLAAAVPATALISKDRDLLKLARVCARKLGLAILTPSQWCALDWTAIHQLSAQMAQRRLQLQAPGF